MWAYRSVRRRSVLCAHEVGGRSGARKGSTLQSQGSSPGRFLSSVSPFVRLIKSRALCLVIFQ